MELSFSPADIAKRYSDIGVGKAKRPASQLIVLGILAGVLIAMAAPPPTPRSFGISDPWTIKNHLPACCSPSAWAWW